MNGPRIPETDPQIDLEAKSFNQSLFFWLSILGVILFFGCVHQIQLANSKNKLPPGIPVTQAIAKSAQVPVYITALGSVIPTYSVTVRTQINGQLMQVLFREGQMVKKGDLLAVIDERPYLAQLTQYQGELERDTALYKNALIDLKRYQTLWKQNSISQQQYATQQSLVQQYEGAIKVDQGLIQATQVNLIYCRIISPVDGRIGLRLIDPGNFVQTTDTTGIAIINTLNPITVVFTIAEDYIPRVLNQIYTDKTLVVQAFDRQQNKLLATGNLLTIDNQIDTTTGTVKLKAQFANDTNRLFPNQFVNVRLLVKTLQNTTVIPTAALQYTTNGIFVYKLNNDLTVKINPVKVGITFGADTAIHSGVKPGEQVIVEGTDKLVDGSRVSLVNQSAQIKTAIAGHKNGYFDQWRSLLKTVWA